MKLGWRKLVLWGGDVLLGLIGLEVWLHVSALPADIFYGLILGFAFLCLWAALFYMFGLYDTKKLPFLDYLLNGGLYAASIGVIATVLVARLLTPALSTRAKVSLAVVTLVTLAAAVSWRHLWAKMVSTSFLRRKVAFLGSDLLRREIALDLAGNTYLNYSNLPADHPDILVMDSTWMRANPDQTREAISRAAAEQTEVMSYEDFYEMIWGKVAPEHAENPAWLMSYVVNKRRLQDIIKRLFDLALLAVSAIAVLPIVAIIAAAAKISQKGPVFYGQKRVGYLGQEFMIWKFRTMDHPEGMPTFVWPFPENAQGRDPRVTALGAWLRRFRLDELPQLLNVLLGDISFVGPRPTPPEETAILEMIIPNYYLRHLAKPGITGWAQINYRAPRNNAEAVERFRHDLYYLKNKSVVFDAGIMLKTLKRVLLHDAAVAPLSARDIRPTAKLLSEPQLNSKSEMELAG